LATPSGELSKTLSMNFDLPPTLDVYFWPTLMKSSQVASDLATWSGSLGKPALLKTSGR